MAKKYHVVDLFAGPGGLAEGFSAIRNGDGSRPFQIELSVEKEKSAHRTLLLRAFLRQFDGRYPDAYYHFLRGGEEPNWATAYPAQWAAAEREALLLELGSEKAGPVVERRLRDLQAKAGSSTIVIGGPPCQAYSMAGRARNASMSTYKPEEDERHFLYREYIGILTQLHPTAFVMENVKGLMSSSVGGRGIFEQVLKDLRSAGGSEDSYTLYAVEPTESGARLVKSDDEKDFLIHAEKFGVPQARHRLIIVGIRTDIASSIEVDGVSADPVVPKRQATVRDVLAGMPALRSGLSRGDRLLRWRAAMSLSCRAVGDLPDDAMSSDGSPTEINTQADSLLFRFRRGKLELPRVSRDESIFSENCPTELVDWLRDPHLHCTPNHASRGHMRSDLTRYLFASLFAQIHGRSPLARDFPADFSPAHKNWNSGKFSDRFRVQVWDLPARTVTSHISQDGHYFIHPDPAQCRSLTVREAARLQTFPDNYFFTGNQTEQFIQVGNAVPPLLARRIAHALWSALQDVPSEKRKRRRTSTRSGRVRVVRKPKNRRRTTSAAK